jgi:hypothetical protein
VQGGSKLQTSFLLSEKNYIKNWFTSWIKRQKKTEVYLQNIKLVSYFAFYHKISGITLMIPGYIDGERENHFVST